MIAHALALGALLVTPLAGVQEEGPVIGHYYDCSATLKLSRGELFFRRLLNEQGGELYKSDTARWRPANGVGGNVSWDATSWYKRVRLSAISGTYDAHIEAGRRLPKAVSWELMIANYNLDERLDLTLSNRTTDSRAMYTTVPLRVILAFAGRWDTVAWKLMDARPRADGERRQYAEGAIDAAALREASDAIPRAVAMLDAMEAAPAEKCTRTPIHYHIESEI
jgi:hypothetical protein